jgi:hypothetical protein
MMSRNVRLALSLFGAAAMRGSLLDSQSAYMEVISAISVHALL